MFEVVRLPLILLICLIVVSKGVAASDFTQIAPGVYVRFGEQQVADHNNLGHIANLGFVVGSERVAVIDAGGSYAEGETVLHAVRRVTELPIAWLILTHMHPDHTLGAAVFAEQGAKIIGHANLADALNNRRDAYLAHAKHYLGEAEADTRIVTPDTTVSVGKPSELDLGGRELVLHAHPTAHTNNDLSVYDRNTGVLWLSDLLFVEHVPVVDGSVLGWLRVMPDLVVQEPAVVVPGHGPVREQWAADLERQQEYLQALADGVREVIRSGGDIRQAVAKVGQHERGRWLLFDEYHGRNVTAAFVELEWE